MGSSYPTERATTVDYSIKTIQETEVFIQNSTDETEALKEDTDEEHAKILALAEETRQQIVQSISEGRERKARLDRPEDRPRSDADNEAEASMTETQVNTDSAVDGAGVLDHIEELIQTVERKQEYSRDVIAAYRASSRMEPGPHDEKEASSSGTKVAKARPNETHTASEETLGDLAGADVGRKRARGSKTAGKMPSLLEDGDCDADSERSDEDQQENFEILSSDIESDAETFVSDATDSWEEATVYGGDSEWEEIEEGDIWLSYRQREAEFNHHVRDLERLSNRERSEEGDCDCSWCGRDGSSSPGSSSPGSSSPGSSSSGPEVRSSSSCWF